MPTNLFTIIARYFWLVCIAINGLNGVMAWRRVQPAIERSPQLADGYRRLIKGWVIYGSIPWVVMGIGVMFGGVPGVFHYFNARNGPFVIAWYASVVAMWLLAGWWLFARRGAETLAAHPGVVGRSREPGHVKAVFGLSVLVGIVVLCFFIFAGVDVE